ncbi:GNAT family N-acetyltransferase [Actinoplanes sp. NEAU-A12]|uniref:GNAT family N-acetyltransferase n=1 Tax=Actinoplanes sandaracinus TaxID=3045177 RepID=A0ABT6WSL5_9ACTN|nr:GNAT family N-acetyltransferase [Actinoplanes sandaracinus]MDI6102720.1 GNAT family N-acetyltransferase [Actinoplanes sandaracinus]
MPELVLPTTRLHAAFLECRDDWGPGPHEDGFGLTPGDDVDSPGGFVSWVDGLVSRTHPAGTPCPPGRHGSPRWIVQDGRILGGIALRHHYDDGAGHIGYGIRPSARGRGLATWALGAILREARAALTVDRVLVVCLAGNLASARTIERNGGVAEDMPAGAPTRRYWITLGE